MTSIKGPILLLIWFLISSLSLQAEIKDDPFNSTLPSQQTEFELQGLNESLQEKDSPQLRARPGDIDGSDQGQKVPLGDFGLIELLLLIAVLSVYCIISKKRRNMKWNYKLMMPLLLFVASFGSINAQVRAVQAVTDNYFIEPGKTSFVYVVLNDDPGSCSEFVGDLELTILTNPAAGVSLLQNPSNPQEIRIRATNTAYGQYSFTYEITCKNDPLMKAQASVYINVAQRPDFISDATCTVDRPAMVWDIAMSKRSSVTVHAFACPVVGDVDGDGKNEIITVNNSKYTSVAHHVADAILIFDTDLNLKKRINVPPMDSYLMQSIAIADIDPVKNDGPEILITTGGVYRSIGGYVPTVAGDPFKLYCYHFNKTTGEYYLKWKSTQTIFSAPPAANVNMGATITISDIDHDGLIEIVVGDRVFSGGDEDGNNGGLLLATLPNIAHLITHPEVGLGRGTSFYDSVSAFQSLTVADVDGDGIEEVITGNAIYDVSVNHSNPALSTTTIHRVMSSMYDGTVSVADLDGDGILDIVTAGMPRNAANLSCLYGWKSTGELLFREINYDGRVISKAFLGDINGNGVIDIALTTQNKLHAWEYVHNPVTNTGVLGKFIAKITSDASGMTTLTLFDFDNNGEAELVYRDQTHIRIIDKNGNNTIATNCNSSTGTEYPLVVDVDGDGHADIIVSGSPTADSVHDVRLWIFKSPTNSWAPARKVWHQFGYNPTQINEDLTIPRYPLNPATSVTRKDGSVHYPYNNFLQQVGYLNTEGDPLQTAPDLAFVNRNQQMTYNAISDEMTVDAYISNDGAVAFAGDILLSLYAYDSSTLTYKQIYFKEFAGESLALIQEKKYTLTIPGFNTLVQNAESSGMVVDKWFLAVNLNDKGAVAPADYHKNQKECISWNNLTSRISYVTGDILICEGETGTIKLQPAGIYDCFWYSVDAGGNKQPFPGAGTNKGDQMPYTKPTDSDRDFLLVSVHAKGSPTPISNIMDSIFIYHPMDTLVWTGAVNSDWHNVNNWRSPKDPTGVAKHRFLPRSCTDVLIPNKLQGGAFLSVFPDLSATGTEYATYNEAQCNNISFEHGGEVRYVDRLSYSKSYINVDMLSNRWYTFAPPLRSFYTGDIYKDKANPFEDGMVAYTRMFSQPDPQHNSHVQGNWGRAFNTPTQSFSVGQGLGVWLDDNEPNEAIKSTQTFLYPKADASYNLYDINPPHVVTGGPFAVADRTLSHRFIFEETMNPTTKDVQLQVAAAAAGQRILLANPYMSHLDFDKFYNYGNNKNLIEPHYTIMEDGYSYATFYLNNPGASTGVPQLDKNIAPMQSIIVEAKVAINPATNPLVTNGTMTTIQPGATLRSAEEIAEEGNNYFKVSISDVKKRNKTSLFIDKKAKSGLTFDKTIDVLKTTIDPASVVETAHPAIYFITDDLKYTDIKALSAIQEFTIPIGINYSGTGPMAIGFENVALFDGYYVYLEDKYEKMTVEILRDSPIYCFTKNTKEAFMNDRFVLKVSKTGSSLEETEMETPIIVHMDGNALSLESKNGEALGQTIIYNIQGMLFFNSDVSHSSIMMNLPVGIYVLKNRNFTTKLISN